MNGPSVWARYRKAVVAVLAQVPAPAVLGLLAWLGTHVPAGVVATIIGGVSVVLTPILVARAKNAPLPGGDSTP